jgi:DNA ligase-1
MIKLIKDLETNGSTLKKTELLKQFKNKELLKRVLFYTLEPNLNFYIKKLPALKTGKTTFETGWIMFEKHLDNLNARLYTGNDAIQRTVELLEKFDAESQKIAKRVLFRDLRCNVSATITNKVFPKLTSEFKVQLANKYDPDKAYKNTLWAASRKMDGLRCVLKNGKLYSRNGKEVIGFDHIVGELNSLGEYELIDGELYSPEIGFQEIQGYVMRKKNVVEEDKKKIFYNIFAMINKTTTTPEMVLAIEKLRAKNHRTYLRFVEYTIIDNDFEKIKALDKLWVSEGYEGVMLRSMDVVYDWKRSDALLKFKSFKEEDLKIVDAIEGAGKYKGMLGAFLCRGKVEGHRIETECGSGYNDKQRAEFWKNRQKMIGTLIEVKYQGLSDDKTSLRFPIFRKTKEDR